MGGVEVCGGRCVGEGWRGEVCWEGLRCVVGGLREGWRCVWEGWRCVGGLRCVGRDGGVWEGWRCVVRGLRRVVGGMEVCGRDGGVVVDVGGLKSEWCVLEIEFSVRGKVGGC